MVCVIWCLTLQCQVKENRLEMTTIRSQLLKLKRSLSFNDLEIDTWTFYLSIRKTL